MQIPNIAVRALVVTMLLSSITVASALPLRMAPSVIAPPSPSILVGTLEFSLTNSSGVYNLIATLAPPSQNLTNPEVNTYIMLDTAQEQVFVNSILASLQQYDLNVHGGIGSVIVTTTPIDFSDAQAIQFSNELVSVSSTWPAIAQYGTYYGGTQAIELTPVAAYWDQNAPIPRSSLLSKVVNGLIVAVTNTEVLCFVAYDNRAILNPTVNVAGPIMPKISNCPQSLANPVYLSTNSQRASPYSPRFIAGPGQKLTVIINGLRSNFGSSSSQPSKLPSLVSLSIQGTYSSYQGDVKLEQCVRSSAGIDQGICVRSGTLPLNVNLHQQCSLTVSSCTSNYVAKVPIIVGIQRTNTN
jgi:hypothetical protein